jgi:hypothetical protein
MRRLSTDSAEKGTGNREQGTGKEARRKPILSADSADYTDFFEKKKSGVRRQEKGKKIMPRIPKGPNQPKEPHKPQEPKEPDQPRKPKK